MKITWEHLTYMDFPYEYWLRIRTNDVIERLNREICRRRRVVGTFPDGCSAHMLVCARIRYVADILRGNKKNMKHLDNPIHDVDSAIRRPSNYWSHFKFAHNAWQHLHLLRRPSTCLHKWNPNSLTVSIIWGDQLRRRTPNEWKYGWQSPFWMQKS